MSTLLELIKLAKVLKPYGPTIAAVASGLGMIASKNYSEGLSTIFQALSLVFGGAAAVGIHHAATAAAAAPKRS